MSKDAKCDQLQIRVSKAEKLAIQHAASRAGMDMSEYVLSRSLPAPAAEFRSLVETCVGAASPRFALAQLNSLLSRWTPGEFNEATAQPPPSGLTPFVLNYVTAMVEYGCGKRNLPVPRWTCAVAPLADPVFATSLKRLRLHLLTRSPPPFRARNIFIDTSLGGQV
jgi:hypothetical protein